MRYCYASLDFTWLCLYSILGECCCCVTHNVPGQGQDSASQPYLLERGLIGSEMVAF